MFEKPAQPTGFVRRVRGVPWETGVGSLPALAPGSTRIFRGERNNRALRAWPGEETLVGRWFTTNPYYASGYAGGWREGWPTHFLSPGKVFYQDIQTGDLGRFRVKAHTGEEYAEYLLPEGLARTKKLGWRVSGGPAGKHRPLLEGLRHGGIAQKLRRLFTNFGSGWQGAGDIDELLKAFDVGSAKMEVLGDEVGWQGLTAAGSGTSHLSHEELARNETFYHVKRGGELTFMGKQPDIVTREGAVVGLHRLTGEVRIVNNYFPGLGDAAVLERVRPTLTRAVMRSGSSQAMAHAGTGSVSATVSGARRMLRSL